jgi:hypothetical protein
VNVENIGGERRGVVVVVSALVVKGSFYLPLLRLKSVVARLSDGRDELSLITWGRTGPGRAGQKDPYATVTNITPRICISSYNLVNTSTEVHYSSQKVIYAST